MATNPNNSNPIGVVQKIIFHTDAVIWPAYHFTTLLLCTVKLGQLFAAII